MSCIKEGQNRGVQSQDKQRQAEGGATAIETEEVLDDAPKKDEANPTSDMKSKKKTKKAYTSYDECGFCGSIHSVLKVQCPRCHAKRYCDEKCMRAHWIEDHQYICKPIAEEEEHQRSQSMALQPASASTSRTVGAAESAATSADGSSAGVDDEHAMAAVLATAGVANPKAVARELHNEETDLATLVHFEDEDFAEFGIVGDELVRRVREGLAMNQASQAKVDEAAIRVVDTLEAARAPRAASAAAAEAPPADLCCPITQVLFVDPVLCVGDGETYERYAIERWFRERQALLDEAQAELESSNGESERALQVLAAGMTSPMGHGVMETMALAPNRSLRRLADDWRASK